MAELNIMPLFTDSLLSDCDHMSDECFGKYMRLLVRWWRRGAGPLNERELRKLSGATGEDLEQIKDELSRTPDGWVKKKLARTYGRQLEKSKEAREATLIRWHRAGKHNQNAHKDCPLCTEPDTIVHTDQDTDVSTDVIQSMNHEPLLLSKDNVKAPAKPSPRDYLEKVLDKERADAVIEHRKRLRAALTAHAAKLLANRLSSVEDPNAAADLMIEKGWKSYQLDWDKGASAKLAREKAKPKPLVMPDNKKDIDVNNRLMKALRPGQFQTWFTLADGRAALRCVSDGDGEDLIVITVDNPTKRDIIDHRFGARLDQLFGKQRWVITEEE